MRYTIPEEVKKYFLSIEGASILARENIFQINEFLNKKIIEQKGDGFDLNLDDKTIRIDSDNFSAVFPYFNWVKLSFEEKAIVGKWIVDDISNKNGVEKSNQPLFWLIADEKCKYKDSAAYSRKFNRIYSNVNGLAYGYNFLRAISHEMKHFIDNYNFSDKRLVDIADKLLSADIIAEKVIPDIIKFNLENAEEFGYSKEKILLLKNVLAPLQANKNIEHKNIKNKDEFQKFFDNAIYFASPMEYTAHEFSLDFTNKIFDENSKNSLNSNMDIFVINEMQELIDVKINESQMFGVQVTDFNVFDICIKNNFYTMYRSHFGNYEDCSKTENEYAELVDTSFENFKNYTIDSAEKSQ